MPNKIKVLACGSRTWYDKEGIRIVLSRIKEKYKKECIYLIEGGANGADILAKEVAKELGGFSIIEVKADWNKHGKSAGPIRNQKMLDMKPNLVVAFWDGKSRGTKDMIDRAKKAGVEWEIHYQYEKIAF